MIKTETIIKEDGSKFIKTSSTLSMYIERNDGVRFVDAFDPFDSGRTYTETDEQVDIEVTEADKDAALRRLGVAI